MTTSPKGWLRAAPKVGEGTTSLPQIGVHTLVFHYKNGKSCSVYPKGGRDGSIMLWDCGNGKPEQLETTEFGQWLEDGWKNDFQVK
jgi:hypothetical protein